MNDRKNWIGGSDVGAILGVHPYRSALDVWAEKTGKLERDDEEIKAKPAVAWGRRLEQTIAEHWRVTNDALFHPSPDELHHPDFPYLRGHVDCVCTRLLVNRKEPDFPLEIKTAGIRQAGRWGEHGSTNPSAIPIEHYCQVQFYAYLMRADRCCVAVLIAGQDYRDFVFPADEDLWKEFETRLSYFWTEHVLKLDPPLPVALDNPRLAQLYKEVTEGTMLADNETTIVAHKLAELKDEKKILDAEIDGLEALIKLRMQGYQVLVDSVGDEVATWRSFEKRQFGAKLFQHDHPDLAAQYTEAVLYRRFLLKIKGDHE